MKTHLLKTSQGIALEIDGVVSDKELEFSEEVSKGIGELWGIVDIHKLAILSYENRIMHSIRHGGLVDGFIDGAETVLAMNKEKLFTREDMEKAITFGFMQCMEFDSRSVDDENTFITSLRPDRVECTVEMEENQCDGCKANLPLIGNVHQCSYPTGNIGCQKEKYNRPKITDGKIKVLTLIK